MHEVIGFQHSADHDGGIRIPRVPASSLSERHARRQRVTWIAAVVIKRHQPVGPVDIADYVASVQTMPSLDVRQYSQIGRELAPHSLRVRYCTCYDSVAQGTTQE